MGFAGQRYVKTLTHLPSHRSQIGRKNSFDVAQCVREGWQASTTQPYKQFGPTIIFAKRSTKIIVAPIAAKFRAARSHFDVHVIYDADWGYWIAEVGDYGHLISRIEDKIVHTVLGGLSDER